MRCPDCRVHPASGHLFGCRIASLIATSDFDEDVAQIGELLRTAGDMICDATMPPLVRVEEFQRLLMLLTLRAYLMARHAAVAA